MTHCFNKCLSFVNKILYVSFQKLVHTEMVGDLFKNSSTGYNEGLIQQVARVLLIYGYQCNAFVLPAEYIPSMIESLEGATGRLTLQDPWVA